MSEVMVALLRAVNVGGTNRLAMADLRALCVGLGLADVETYIQSGNVVFRTDDEEPEVVASLGRALEAQLGRPVGVVVRPADELAAVLARNPFGGENPKLVHVIFLPAPPPAGALAQVVAPEGEQVSAEGREIYVRYPNGQGKSKLKLPFAKAGTARNLNTVTRLIELATAMRG